MRLLQSIALILLIVPTIQAQRLVKLNLLEKSPLANMVVYSMNDSTANYTKLIAGTGIQITYNENDTTLTITATGTSVGVPQTLSLDDGTRVLSISDGNSVDLSESIQEEINAMLVAGDNVTLTYDDVANTLTIASNGGGGGATNIGDLGDVTITSATTGQVLKYDGAAWINGVDLNTETLSALTDVDTTGKTDGSIVLYNSTSGNWEAQANSIDNLTDGYFQGNNMFIGVKPANLTTSQANVNLGRFAGQDLSSGNENTNIGDSAGAFMTTGIRNTNVGRVAGGYVKTGIGNTNYGAFAGTYNYIGIRNTNIGLEVNAQDTMGNDNVVIGALANTSYLYQQPFSAIGYIQSDSVTIIGSHAKALNPISTNEIIVGAFATGNGSNTATLGNNNITATYLKGTTNLRGYGLGNKEAADIGKTASAYIAGYATDGTLIELPSSGLGISLTDLSVTQNSPGTAGLTYNNTNGVFTYTPPDLSSYLTAEVDGSVTNEIQDLSLTGNTLSLSGDATTVDLSTYLDDQTIVLTQGGIVSISGTYPNFTISATEVDGSVTNEIQDLSLTGNVLSLSGDATTVDLTESVQDEINNTITAGEGISVVYDDGAGTLTISAPSGAGNTDEQTLSINNATAELSISNGNTVDLSEAILEESTTASNGLTLSGTDVKLGGTLSDATTTIDMNNNALTFTNNGGYNLSGTGGLSFTNTSATDYSSVLSINPTNTRIYADGGTTEPLNSLNLTSTRSGVKELDLRSSISNDNTTYTMIALNPTRFSMKTPNVTDLTATNGQFLKLVDRLTGEVEFADALTAEVDGSVTNEIQDLSLTGNTLSLSSDATTVDLSPYLDEATTASNGLTLSGTDVKLGGTLTEITNIAMGGFNASIFDVTSSTGLAIQPSINEVIMYGTQSFTDYGSGNKEAGDLSKTFSGHYAGFATDGTVIEVNALPITSGTSATIDWGNMPQRIHVLDFGFNTILTLAFSNVLVGGIYTLRVTGNAGTDTLIWPAAAKFEDGSSVGIVTLQNGGQMFTFYWDGTNYWVK